MRFLVYLLGVLSFFTCATWAATTSSSSSSSSSSSTSTEHTTIWATGTISGKLTTYQTLYRQSFMSTFTTPQTSDIKSGQIGLGSVSGEVGNVREYSRSTIQANMGNADLTPASLYASLAGISFLLVGAIL